MLELNELLELEEVIRDVLNDDLERILIELNRTGELETFLRLLPPVVKMGTDGLKITKTSFRNTLEYLLTEKNIA